MLMKIGHNFHIEHSQQRKKRKRPDIEHDISLLILKSFHSLKETLHNKFYLSNADIT